MHQHHSSATLSRNHFSRPNLAIADCIKIEGERISRSQFLFHGIRFNLNKDSLREIQQTQQRGDSLQLSPHLLTDLRYYALIDDENRWQSGLTFCTYYQRGNSEEALMRSVISLDGDIIHQIQRNCLERPKFSSQITSAHYWLIEQVMGQLRLRRVIPLTRLSHLLAWGLALLIGLVTVILFISVFLNQPWMLLGVIVMVCLFCIGFQRIFRLFLPRLRRWIMQRILSGFISSKPKSKQFAKRLLIRLFS